MQLFEQCLGENERGSYAEVEASRSLVCNLAPLPCTERMGLSFHLLRVCPLQVQSTATGDDALCPCVGVLL